MKKCNDDTTVLVQTPLRDCHVLLESLQDKRTKRQGVMLSYCGPQEKHVNKISLNGRHRSKPNENKSEAIFFEQRVIYIASMIRRRTNRKLKVVVD